MKENIFELTTMQLKGVAENLQTKIEEGLCKENQEILCIPTHITASENIKDEKVLALDWGGTNFRAAIVEVKNGEPKIIEELPKFDENGKKNSYRLSKDETVGFTGEKLCKQMAEWIARLEKLDASVTKIGYCFSYPAASRLNGDAILLRWPKGIDIPDMINKSVGEMLLGYLNNHKGINTEFKEIKVINDTVACLFAGLKTKGYDAYIGLIVGTGTNMAALMPRNEIEKLKSNSAENIPVNLESGNFNPPYLTVIDGLVDAMSNNKSNQRFEKAVSGGYLGEIFKTVFSDKKIKYDFDGGDLAGLMDKPQSNPEDQVNIANWIYARSAKLVAASIVGLVNVLVAQNPKMKNICLAADGSVIWGMNAAGKNPHKDIVEKELAILLPEGVKVTIIDEMKNPNLEGAAIAALS